MSSYYSKYKCKVLIFLHLNVDIQNVLDSIYYMLLIIQDYPYLVIIIDLIIIKYILFFNYILI